jgi:indole-3-glycerol phosphate synthase
MEAGMQKTPDILAKIVRRKREEIAERKQQRPEAQLRQALDEAPPPRDFLAALNTSIAAGRSAVIAEVKKASPSKGVIREDFDPAQIARSYEKGGASCLSVLTDIDFFQGSDDYLKQARAACTLPVIRKDFIVDPYQVLEARAMGADCILLIAACLASDEMQALHELARELKMHTLIEVHDRPEMERALQVGGELLGVNNRNLHSFEVDLNTTLELQSMVPEGTLLVTESGILDASHVALMRENGIHAFLVGEAFMRAEEPGQRLAELFGL